MRRRLNNDRGALSVEAAVVFSIMLIGCLAIGVVVLNSTEAASTADAAAEAGARAATKAQTTSGASSAAKQAIAASSTSSLVVCAMDDIDAGLMQPGQPITVRVSCRSSESGFGSFVTGGRAYSATATEVIDAFRTGAGT